MSGGQTGVDRAGLDFAISAGLLYGGWCPHGGWAEDHETPPGILDRYPLLKETPSDDPDQRTEWNVRDSDATLIITRSSADVVSAGTELTERFASRFQRPCLVVDVAAEGAPEAIEEMRRSLPDRPTLNVAGPRESEAVGIYHQAREVLGRSLGGGDSCHGRELSSGR